MRVHNVPFKQFCLISSRIASPGCRDVPAITVNVTPAVTVTVTVTTVTTPHSESLASEAGWWSESYTCSETNTAPARLINAALD